MEVKMRYFLFMDKLSYFSKKGDFIKEQRIITGARKFIPLGNLEVARSGLPPKICPKTGARNLP